MAKCMLLTGTLLLIASGTVLGQEPATPGKDAAKSTPRSGDVSLSELKPTPEMWFYLQERQRYDSPKLAVRRNAEIDANQRNQRLAAQKWLGQSPQRPNVYSTIFGGHFPGTFPYGQADRWNGYFSVDRTPWLPNR